MMRFWLVLLLGIAPSGLWAQDWVAPFKQSISNCWNPAGISENVDVGFALDGNGRIVGEVTLIDLPNPTKAQQDAFMAARRAILRCQGPDGYDLPTAEFETWRNVEMSFTLPNGTPAS